MAQASITDLDRDLRVVRRGLRQAGVHVRILNAVSTRALRSQRRQTGQFRSNRASRWTLDPEDPQYGTEVDCKVMLLRLYGMMLEFRNAPEVDDVTRETLEKYLGKPIERGTYRDALTKEILDYERLVEEAESAIHGVSSFHLGHEDPTATPRHRPDNISWRSARSNLIQGDLTLPQARAKFVELIARYFDLGEVSLESDDT